MEQWQCIIIWNGAANRYSTAPHRQVPRITMPSLIPGILGPARIAAQVASADRRGCLCRASRLPRRARGGKRDGKNTAARSLAGVSSDGVPHGGEPCDTHNAADQKVMRTPT